MRTIAEFELLLGKVKAQMDRIKRVFPGSCVCLIDIRNTGRDINTISQEATVGDSKTGVERRAWTKDLDLRETFEDEAGGGEEEDSERRASVV